MTTHAQQLVKDMKSNPRKARKFKFLTENTNVDTKNIPHPPKCEKSQISHSIPIANDTLETEAFQRNAVSPVKHSLLDGCYDESQSANSFKEALNDWRNAKSETETETMTSSTEPMQQRKPIELPAFQPNQNLSYFDRLMLRKYKSEVTSNSARKVPSPEIQNSVLRNSVSEYNIFYSQDPKIEHDAKNIEVLEITEVIDSDECDANKVKNFEDTKGPSLKIVTQTNLSDFFLLGTAKSNEDSFEVPNEFERNHKSGESVISVKNQAWKPSESVQINQQLEPQVIEDNSSDSDLPIQDIDGHNDTDLSEDDDILTLERLSEELKSGAYSDTILWSDLMKHRPPTSSDFN